MPAVPSSISPLRRRAVEFASSAGAPDAVAQDIAIAVSEIVTNAVVHAYGGGENGQVALSCRMDGERIIVEVADEGMGLGSPSDSSGIGHGLAMVGAVAQSLFIGPGPGRRGTVVRMAFGAAPSPSAPPGLEDLCSLALDTTADVSCVDVIHEGVLRRVAAEVAHDSELSAWLRAAVPPAKPGTATWSALREGGARLVVHDPAILRSPGGPGERLNLTWWVAVALETSDGTPTALWGLGGRHGGRPVPSDEVVGILGDAGRAGLAHAADRAMLAARLTSARPE